MGQGGKVEVRMGRVGSGTQQSQSSAVHWGVPSYFFLPGLASKARGLVLEAE